MKDLLELIQEWVERMYDQMAELLEDIRDRIREIGEE